MSMTVLTQMPGFSGEYEKKVPVPCMEELTINVMGERITLWIPEESTSLPHLDEFLEDCVRPRPGSLLWDLCDAVGFFKVGNYDPIEQHECMATRGAIGYWMTLDQQMKSFELFDGWNGAPLDDGFAELHESIHNDEHAEAYEQWIAEAEGMEDLHEKSLFTEWNQSLGCSTFVGGDMGKSMRVPEYTPEMLVQRDYLNWCFNFAWNNPCFTSVLCSWTKGGSEATVPNHVELLELVSVGENYSIAKSDYGAVYISKAAMNYLDRNGGCEVGAKLDGRIEFTPGKGRFHWRLVPNGITYTYAE